MMKNAFSCFLMPLFAHNLLYIFGMFRGLFIKISFLVYWVVKVHLLVQDVYLFVTGCSIQLWEIYKFSWLGLVFLFFISSWIIYYACWNHFRCCGSDFPVLSFFWFFFFREWGVLAIGYAGCRVPFWGLKKKVVFWISGWDEICWIFLGTGDLCGIVFDIFGKSFLWSHQSSWR